METLQIQGQILNIFGNEFILDSSFGNILVDTGPSWYFSLDLEEGEQVTVIGEADDEDFDAFSITRSNGEIISIREPQGPPPWAGERENYRNDFEDDFDDDDDFLTEIAGEVVNIFENEFILNSNGEEILVEANTDSPLNLEVGEEVTVFGEADDEDLDAITITRSNGEVFRFDEDDFDEDDFDEDDYEDDFDEDDFDEDDRLIEVSGTIVNLVSEELVLDSNGQTFLVEPDSDETLPMSLQVGERITVFGEADDEDLDAITITRSNGEVFRFDEDDDEDDFDEDDFDEDDRLIEVSGTIVNLVSEELVLDSNGQTFLVEPDSDETLPMSLQVGERITVFGEADDEDLDAITITRSNGEVFRFDEDDDEDDFDEDDFDQSRNNQSEENSNEQEKAIEIANPIAQSMPIFGTTEDNVFPTTNLSQVMTSERSIVFAGSGNDIIDGSGSEGGKRFYAGSGDDILIAGHGNHLFGNSGDDSLFVTDGGDNTLIGGLGADTFYLATADIPQTMNLVRDFTLGEDTIAIAGFERLTWEDITLSSAGSSTIVTIFDQDIARLAQTTPESLSSEDFSFPLPLTDFIP